MTRSRSGLAGRSLGVAAVAAIGVAAVALVGCGAGAVPFSEPDEDVRGNLGGYFFWAVSDPSRSIDAIAPEGAAELVDRADGALPADLDEAFGVSLVASFATSDDAATAADEVRAELAGDGNAMRWGGDAEAADDAVFTLGSLLVVVGVETNDPPGAADPDPRPAHPLVELVEAQGGEALLEGADLGYGESSIVVDLACTMADSAAGPAILDELGDAIATSQFNTRPPWIGPPPTEEEALARATYRRWTLAAAEALNDPKIAEFADRLMAAANADKPAIMAELQAYLQERGLENLEGQVDPVTIALLVDGGAGTDDKGRAAWTAEVGARMGNVELEETEHGPAPRRADYERMVQTGILRFEAGRIEIGWVMFGRAAIGLPLLAGYLTERGCDDIRAGIVDFEVVRGD